MNKIVVYPIFVTTIAFILVSWYLYSTHPSDDTNPVNMNDILIKSVLISSVLGLFVAGYIRLFSQNQNKKMKFRLK